MNKPRIQVLQDMRWRYNKNIQLIKYVQELSKAFIFLDKTDERTRLLDLINKKIKKEMMK